MKRIAALVACLAIAGAVVAESGADVTSLSLSLSESSSASYASGTSFFYNPSGSNSGSFTITASTAADNGIKNVDFPALFGSDELLDTGSPYSQTYSWTASSTDTGSKTVIATENTTNLTRSATFSVVSDRTAPSGQTVALSGGPGYAGLSVPLVLSNGSDNTGGSGVDSSSGVVERAGAPYANGACGTFGSFATVSLSGSSDTSVQTGNCYRYRYKVSDNVGNVATVSANSGTALVDTTAPSAPALTFSGLSHAAASGSIVFYNATGNTAFTVTATASDGESGVGSYAFPSFSAATMVGAGPSRTFSFATGQSITPGTFNVSAVNNTGATSAPSSFSLVADGKAPALSIRCNGKPCRAAAYPKGVKLTFSAVDAGGSGVDTIRYTFDGTTPTADHGAEYDGAFSVKTLTRVKVRAFDRVGNSSRVFNVTVRTLADRFAFTAPAEVDAKVGIRYLSARVNSTHRALATVTMTGPKLVQPRRWQFIVAPGTTIVQLVLPKLVQPGRYTFVWSVKSDTHRTKRTTTLVVRRR